MVKPGPYMTSIITSCLFFNMRCLRQICGSSLLDHMTNLVIWKRCETFSVDSVDSSEAKGLGGSVTSAGCPTADCPSTHAWTVVGQNCRGRPWTVWKDVVLSDIHKLLHPRCCKQGCLEGAALRRTYLMPAG